MSSLAAYRRFHNVTGTMVQGRCSLSRLGLLNRPQMNAQHDIHIIQRSGFDHAGSAKQFFFRAAYVWPYTVAAPAAGLAFRFLLSPEAGLLAAINRAFPGLWNPALDGTDAMILVVVAYSWKYVAYDFIFFLAALQAIPRPIVESAAMDGAGPLRRMWDHQFPLITPTFFFILVINITESFVDSFGIVDLTTEGGPAKSTDLMVYKIYFDGFKGLDYSGAAAQSLVLMALVMILTFFQFRFIERKMHYS